ncbi:BREX-1 system adenine-specific DNA-methyltransferase PglX [Shouchella miscanthi]|uniref:BREX-1 system adenine-specific DNA-methyltransferase PglX n=1 Tax=Shouchella miscanthi TaxID=2598861 RepID=UPI0011A37F25|nr:BREX-1 system adenine-specific DNA-methyltransferase PglX [Shouchella miscanthi]
MNKSALKTFATNARRELLKKVEARAMKLGITEENIKKTDIESSDAIFIDGKQLLREERIQRERLIDRINQIGFKRVIDEVAYTWFNRFTALRFMEVNNYLPTKVRVLSSSNSVSTEPDMMKEALSLDLDLDKEYIYDLKMNNNSEELFKYLIIKHCNDLNRYMPFMFETIDDYREILFPEGLLATDSFVRQMTNTDIIPEDNWEEVEIVGWMYQYYIAEENERVIQAKKRYKTEEIPFATQLFTPEWIVSYMVQNALGRYWIESHPEHRDLIKEWKFYLENPDSEPTHSEELNPYINKELKIEDIKCIDPAMGSGHILIYMFDVLFEIYSKCGYIERDIPRLIIENNIYGLDIDDRAYQLASFSLIMKALKYDRRFLRSIERSGLKINLVSLQETNAITEEEIEFFAGGTLGDKFERIEKFIKQFQNAKTIGSLIQLEFNDFEFIKECIEEIEQQDGNLFEVDMKQRLLPQLKNLIKQTAIMRQQYDVFITNPPYAGSRYLPSEVTSYLTKNYPKVKSDLYSAFMECSFHYTKQGGQIGFITPYVWMFISSYEYIRKRIVEEKSITSLVQLEYNGFEAAMVPVCLFTLRNYHIRAKGDYIRLSEFKGIGNQSIKTLEAVKNPSVKYRYSFDQENLNEIPGSPIAYWASESVIKIYDSSQMISDVGFSKKGLDTSNNNLYLRMWFEIDYNKKNRKWIPLNKGGSFRKWYGNQDYLINWENNGESLKSLPKANIRNEKFYFKEGLSWSDLTSGSFGARFFPEGFIFEATGPCYFGENTFEMLAYMNSKVFNYLAQFTMSTMHYTNGAVANMPYKDIKVNVDQIKDIVFISKNDWDSFETSWGFEKHPFLKSASQTIESSFIEWKHFANERFIQLKEYEEEINRFFIEIYSLQEDLSSEVEDKDITIRKANLKRDIKSFISYAIGCSFGRYSLDEDGLIYAGGVFDASRFKTFTADQDNILPILSGKYFEDDVVSKFVEFVRVIYGEETLSKNLDFIADALGRKKSETAKETLRRYFLNDFYKEHVRTYSKRPIYWLFTSGKEKAFNCLIYMHRYNKTTLSRIRTDYLHDYQVRLDAEKKDLLNIIDGDSTVKEISNAKKELKSLDKKIDELKEYDELLHHMADMQIEIDLDDGVKVNYEKFNGLVAKI